METRDFGRWNKELVRASQTNGHLDFTAARKAHVEEGAEEPVLDSEIFRSLYIGRVPGDAPHLPACTRWKILGATFDHHLDLSDGPVSGSILPSLHFEDCTFHFGFRADHTAIRRLTFLRCNFGIFTGFFDHPVSISLHNTHLAGDLTLQALQSTDRESLLSIAGFGLQVDGSVLLSDTRLVAPADERTTGDQRPHYALDLFGLTTMGNLHLYPRVEIEGGLRLRQATIGGDIAFTYVKVTDGLDADRRNSLTEKKLTPRFAIDGASTTASGHIFFQSVAEDPVFTASGPVDFFGSRTKGTVVLSGAQFSALDSDFALRFGSGHIDGNLISSPVFRNKQPADFTVRGTLNLSGLCVGGTVQLFGKVHSLDAARLTVVGDTAFPLQVESNVNLGGAALKGQLDLSKLSFLAAPSLIPTLTMKDADIGHSLYLAKPAIGDLIVRSARRTELLCYPGYHLFEIQASSGVGSLLFKPGKEPFLLLLDGTSPSLHRLSRSGALDLFPPEALEDYVRFFGAYVWGEEGAFAIIEDRLQIPQDGLTEEQLTEITAIKITKDDFSAKEWDELRDNLGQGLTDEQWVPYQEHLRQYARKASASVRYSNQLFHAHFVVITKTFEEENERLHLGWISMLDDNPVAPLNAKKLPTYNRPYVLRKDPSHSDYRPLNTWKSLGERELTLRFPNWRDLLGNSVGLKNADVDLTNATCRTLEDAQGSAWREIKKITLENFTYTAVDSRVGEEPLSLSFAGKQLRAFYEDRIPPLLLFRPISWVWFSKRVSAATTHRLRLLHRMPTFLPQPYTQLAKVLNAYGDTHTANAIEEEKIRRTVQARSHQHTPSELLSVPGRPLYRFLMYLYKYHFRYGLSPWEASLTVVFCIAFGWKATYVMNYSEGYLVQPPYGSTSPPCRDSINGLLYAADVFIPLLDLRQESRCDVRAPAANEINPIHEWQNNRSWHKLTHGLWAIRHAPVLWAQFAKSAYAVLGWVVISLTILTYSGTLRRWGEK